MAGFVERLRAIVGDKGLVTDDQGKHPYLTDWRENYLGAALAVAMSTAALIAVIVFSLATHRLMERVRA